jgi:integrase
METALRLVNHARGVAAGGPQPNTSPSTNAPRTPHIARHTFASLLASAGVSIYKIAQWLDDDVRVVQQHYAKLPSR